MPSVKNTDSLIHQTENFQERFQQIQEYDPCDFLFKIQFKFCFLLDFAIKIGHDIISKSHTFV